ncbi:hypothetical protein [Carboxylicivirga taeanensis]|uniref:hypothetical protein n=1 Tax=Carboxylicivirga taeanensis TaxID=1416875 RepID=UPI003F6E3A77
MNYLTLVLLLLSNVVTAQLTKTWETKPVLEVPESVKFYHEGNCMFVSNIVGKPLDKDGIGYLTKLSVSGEILVHKWVDGLNAPKGMAIKEGLLFVTDIDDLVVIDIEKAKIIKRIHQPAAVFLNDVTITHEKDVLVSDTQTSTIYVLENNKLVPWLTNEAWGRINGLFAEKDYVLLGTGNSIIKISVATKDAQLFIETGGQADGIEADGKGGYYYSFWKGALYHYTPGEKPRQLLNTAEQNIQSADIGYNTQTHEVLVPTFFANQVVAYKLD